MKYRYVGNSGLAVSSVCLGTATFGQEGWGCDEETATEILDAYAAKGGNFIDTADKYGQTQAEQIIGRWIASRRREDYVLATKCFFETAAGINDRGLSRRHILSACDASLKRLGTDYIDLYQAHELDPQAPMEETMSALDALVQQGKVRYLGCSNFPAWKVTKAQAWADRSGRTGFISGQYLYNLLKRDIEAEILPACQDARMGVLCWSPLSGGMLTGKYLDADRPPADTRLGERPDVTAGRYDDWRARSDAIVRKVLGVARNIGVEPSVVALAWLLTRPGVSAVLAGAKRPSQIVSTCLAGDCVLPGEDIAALDELSCPRHPYPHDICANISRGWFTRMG